MKKELTRKDKTKQSAKKFKLETKKAVNTAMIAAFGFLIALVWRDVITEFVTKIAESSPVTGKLISAFVITFICVVGILIVTHFFKIEG